MEKINSSSGRQPADRMNWDSYGTGGEGGNQAIDAQYLQIISKSKDIPKQSGLRNQREIDPSNKTTTLHLGTSQPSPSKDTSAILVPNQSLKLADRMIKSRQHYFEPSQVEDMFSEDVHDENENENRKYPNSLQHMEILNDDKKPRDHSEFAKMIKERQMKVETKLALIQERVDLQTKKLDSFTLLNSRYSAGSIKPYSSKPGAKPAGMIDQAEADLQTYKQRSTIETTHSPYLVDLRLNLRNEISVPFEGQTSKLEITENPFMESGLIPDELPPSEINFIKQSKRTINTSDNISGGMQPYRQSNVYTSRSIASSKNKSPSPRCSSSRLESPPKSIKIGSPLKHSQTTTSLMNITENDVASQILRADAIPLHPGSEIYQCQQPPDVSFEEIEAARRGNAVRSSMQNATTQQQEQKRLSLIATNSLSTIKAPKKTAAAARKQSSKTAAAFGSTVAKDGTRSSRPNIPLKSPTKPVMRTSTKKQQSMSNVVELKSEKKRREPQKMVINPNEERKRPAGQHQRVISRQKAKDLPPQLPRTPIGPSPQKRTRAMRKETSLQKKQLENQLSQVALSSVEEAKFVPDPPATSAALSPEESKSLHEADLSSNLVQAKFLQSELTLNITQFTGADSKKETWKNIIELQSKESTVEEIQRSTIAKLEESDQEEQEIIQAKVAQMQKKDLDLIQQREETLKFLIEEEQLLYKYSTEPLEVVQQMENEAQAKMRREQADLVDYKTILYKAKIEKTRVLFFVRHLQISLILTKALIQVFSPGLLQKFQVKLQSILQNIHQNFLLMVDMILKEYFLQSQAGVPYDTMGKHELFAFTERGLKVTECVEYKLLKNITVNKLRAKEKHAKTLTSFRQNNELNTQTLKKVVKYIIESYSQECVAFKVLAFDIQEVMKQHLSNIIPNLTNANYDIMTDMPTATICFINKTIAQRVQLLVVHGEKRPLPEPKEEAPEPSLSSQKRPKSSLKMFLSPPERDSEKQMLQNLYMNKSLVHSGTKQPQQQTDTVPAQPASINELIESAKQGVNSGVLASRKSSAKKKESPNHAAKHNFNNQGALSQQLRDLHSPEKLKSRTALDYRTCAKPKERPESPKLDVQSQRSGQGMTNEQRVYQMLRQSSNSALGMSSVNKRMDALQEMSIKKNAVHQYQSPLKTRQYVSPVKKYQKQFQRVPSVAQGNNARPSSRASDSKANHIQPYIKGARQSQKTTNRNAQLESETSKVKRSAASNQLNEQQRFLLPESVAFLMQLDKDEGKSNVSGSHRGEPAAHQGLHIPQNNSIMNVNNNINFYGPVINHMYQPDSETQLQPEGARLIDLESSDAESGAKKMQSQTSKKASRRSQEELIDHLHREYMIKEKKRAALRQLAAKPSPTSKKIPIKGPGQSEYSTTKALPTKGTQVRASTKDLSSPLKVQSRGKSGIGSGTKNLLKPQPSASRHGFSTVSHFVLPTAHEAAPPRAAGNRQAAFTSTQKSLGETQVPEPQSLHVAPEQSPTALKNTGSIAQFRETQMLPENNVIDLSLSFEEQRENAQTQQVDLILTARANQKKHAMESPAREAVEVTEPRKYQRDGFEFFKPQDDEASQNTIKRQKQLNKRYFIGEYDATVEEEQSLILSQAYLEPQQSHSSHQSSHSAGDPAGPSSFLQQDAASRNLLIKLQEIPQASTQLGAGAGLKLDLAEASQVTSQRDHIQTERSSKSKRFSLLKSERQCEGLSFRDMKSIPTNQSKKDAKSSERNTPRESLNSFKNEVEQLCDVNEEANEVPQLETNQEEIDELEQIEREFKELRDKVTIPYLPPISQSVKKPKFSPHKPYTLVLDLDETLIHFEDETDPTCDDPGSYNIRPGALKFLQQLSDYYEIVIFTAAMPDYADWILDNIDRQERIAYRLYRQHTTPHEDYAIKDLKNLGRDLTRTIIIDNLAENFNYTTPLNGIWVESWYNDMDDSVLHLLIPFLKQVVVNQVNVQELLTDYIKETFIYHFLEEQRTLPNPTILIMEQEEYRESLEK